MIALCVILGIILLFYLLLKIRFRLQIEYENEKLVAYAKYLFIKIPILPLKEKEKKPKPEKKKEDKPKEKKEEPKKKSTGDSNPLAAIKQLLKDEGFDGIVDLLSRFGNQIAKFGHRFAKSFIINQMMIDVSVTGGDAADTAEKYGKLCQKIFPVTGYICSECTVRQYEVNVYPDYIAKYGKKATVILGVSVIPGKLIHSLLMFVFGLVFKMGIKLLKDLKGAMNTAKANAPKKPPKVKTEE